MSKRNSPVRASWASSSPVSKSKSSVPVPASWSARATAWLRGLCRLLPLPCANSTTPTARVGTHHSPARVTPPSASCRLRGDVSRFAVVVRSFALMMVLQLQWTGPEKLDEFHHHRLDLVQGCLSSFRCRFQSIKRERARESILTNFTIAPEGRFFAHHIPSIGASAVHPACALRATAMPKSAQFATTRIFRASVTRTDRRVALCCSKAALRCWQRVICWFLNIPGLS